MSDQPDPAAPQPDPVPPAPSGASFSPHGSGHGLPASVPPAPVRDLRLDQIGKWLVGVIATGMIAGIGFVFGHIFTRLGEAETSIHSLDKKDTAYELRITALETQTQKQWELISGVNKALTIVESKVEAKHPD